MALLGRLGNLTYNEGNLNGACPNLGMELFHIVDDLTLYFDFYPTSNLASNGILYDFTW